MANGPELPTEFAPAERTPERQLVEQEQVVSATAVRQVLDACPNATAVLNTTRQIIFCNRALVGLAEGLDEQSVWGMRPGEALSCQHAHETRGGCGTTEFCRTCGAVLAILDGQQGKRSTRDCRLTRNVGGRHESLDLRVTVSPLPVSDRFVVCSIEDVSHETRRRALERVFFHDILNTALALQASAQALSAAGGAQSTSEALVICRAAVRLFAEIDSQRLLLAAETDDLTPRPTTTTSLAAVLEVIDEFRLHPMVERKQLVIDAGAHDVEMRIDKMLLDRVLVNMVKNALEASEPGQTVTIGCRTLAPNVEFTVHNDGVIPREVQLQIFQRSFSTKGAARGLGTYSMKLFTDRYLNGELRFETSAAKGTTFFLRVPAMCAPAVGGTPCAAVL